MFEVTVDRGFWSFQTGRARLAALFRAGILVFDPAGVCASFVGGAPMISSSMGAGPGFKVHGSGSRSSKYLAASWTCLGVCQQPCHLKPACALRPDRR